uniref:Uncharacterized protein n=1 Tax=Knipowitschia caucasica TaxID=637954 RepID=A0AAV2MPV1_KNICA
MAATASEPARSCIPSPPFAEATAGELTETIGPDGLDASVTTCQRVGGGSVTHRAAIRGSAAGTRPTQHRRDPGETRGERAQSCRPAEVTPPQ